MTALPTSSWTQCPSVLPPRSLLTPPSVLHHSPATPESQQGQHATNSIPSVQHMQQPQIQCPVSCAGPHHGLRTRLFPTTLAWPIPLHPPQNTFSSTHLLHRCPLKNPSVAPGGQLCPDPTPFLPVLPPSPSLCHTAFSGPLPTLTAPPLSCGSPHSHP